jgi:threonine dehydratase
MGGDLFQESPKTWNARVHRSSGRKGSRIPSHQSECHALVAGRLVELPAITSIARTLGAPQVSEFTLRQVLALVEEVVVVEDAAVVAALIRILEWTKYLTEPAASCCLAAAECHRPAFTPQDRVVLLLCGGNLSVGDLCAFRQQFSA